MEFCKGCAVSCCSHYYLPLSAVDVFIISVNGWKDFFFIEEKAAENANDTCFAVRNRFYALMMKKRIQGGCVFINEKGDYCCGIEEYKPSVCAAYPFQRNGERVVISKNRVCPKNRKPTKKDLEKAKETLQNYEYEWGLHRKIVRKWNGSFLSKYGWPGLFIPYAMMQMLIWNAAARLGRVER